jgi:hypothetical protein
MARLEKTAELLPLALDLERRWQGVLDAQEDQPPLVYAQPLPASGAESGPASGGQRRVARPQPSATSPVVASAAPPQDMPKPDLVVDSGQREGTQVGRPEKSSNFPPSTVPLLPQPGKTTRPPANRIEKSAKPSPPAGSPPHPKAGSTDKAPATTSVVKAPATPSVVAEPTPAAGASQTGLILPAKSAPASPISSATHQDAGPLPVVMATSKAAAAPATANGEDRQPKLVVVTPKAALKAGNGRPPVVKPSRTKAGPGQESTGAATAARSGKPQLPVVRPHSPAPKTVVSFPPAPTSTRLPVVQPIEARLGQSPRDLPLPSPAGAQAAQTPGMSFGPAKPRVSPALASNVIQRTSDSAAVKKSAAGSTPAGIGVDEIVEEVQRQFMRQLAIEGERRGVTSWQ